MTWICAALLIAGGVGFLNLPTLFVLTTRGQETTGVVLWTEPRQHRSVHYEYWVRGEHYISASQGGAGAGNRDFDHLTQGDRVHVYFDPHDPRLSHLGEPGPALQNEVAAVGVAAVVFPTLLVIGRAREARRRTNGRASR